MPVFFSDAEWAFVNAAVDRLIPADAQGPGGVEAGVPVFIDRQLDMPYGHGAYFYMQGPFHPDAPPSLGYQLQYTPRELYRLGIAAADSACKQAKGKVFADLPHPEQEQFLTSLEKGTVTLQGPPAAAFFEQLLDQHPGRLLRRPDVRRQPRHGRLEDDRFSRRPGRLHQLDGSTRPRLPVWPNRNQRVAILMATRKKPVDAVIIGYGWTGAIMAKTLTDEGLSVVALERGPARDTAPDFEYPRIIDELKHGIRGELWQPLAKETMTIRHSSDDVASPYRRYGSFVLGTGVGGAGVHWNGQLWRASPEDLRLRSHIEQRYGKKFIPADMTIQDYPVTFEELEPHFDHFEKVCGTTGIAGNLRGTLKAGGNPFEGPRSDEFPSPPLPPVYRSQLFAKAAGELGYKPFPVPSANSSRAYTNPYGVRLGPCNMCGFCERFGCFLYSKASPQTTILPILANRPHLEVRPNSYVTRILLDKSRTRATGVLYVDAERQGGGTARGPGGPVRISVSQRAPVAHVRHRQAL